MTQTIDQRHFDSFYGDERLNASQALIRALQDVWTAVENEMRQSEVGKEAEETKKKSGNMAYFILELNCIKENPALQEAVLKAMELWEIIKKHDSPNAAHDTSPLNQIPDLLEAIDTAILEHTNQRIQKKEDGYLMNELTPRFVNIERHQVSNNVIERILTALNHLLQRAQAIQTQTDQLVKKATS